MDKISIYLIAIEAKRKANKLHINKLCGFVGITPTYYRLLMQHKNSPSASVLFALIEAVNLKILLLDGDFIG
jgi:transcriptional regulator with XRE-family HTH domain